LIGYAFMLLSIVSFAALHTIYRITGRRKCRVEAVNAVFLSFASAAACVAGAVLQPDGFIVEPEMRIKFVLLAAVTGVMVPLGVLFYMAALKVGKMAPSAMALGLSIIVPIFGSILVFGERLTPSRAAAICLALISIVFLWLDKRGSERSGRDVG